MQRDANTMAHVVLVLLNLIQHLVTFCGDNGDTLELLADIEKRWNQEENALFFLGFALHPEYNKTAVWILTQSLAKDGNWGDKENYLSVERLVQAAKFYYGKYELHDSEATDVTKEQALNRLGKSLKKWLVKPSDLRLDMFEHGENEVEYWNMQKLEHYEIANLAAFLLDAVIQAATCERIFKGYAQFHTKARNKLHPETTHQLTQVKRHVQHGNPDDVSMAKMSKNRIIPVTQHVRLDNDFASQSVVAMDSDTDDQGGGNKNDEWEEEEETDLPELVDASGVRVSGPVDGWLYALSLATLEDTDGSGGFFETDDEATGEEDSDTELDRNCFERRSENLEDLPSENLANYRQENWQYMAAQREANKFYVRTDKYKFRRLVGYCASLPEGSALPTIMSAYNNK